MYKLLANILFLLSPETAHHFTLFMLRIALSVPGLSGFLKRQWAFEDESLRTEVAGLVFKNPVGLAAGFDKDAKYIDIMSQLGFGFIEIGTVTPQPQKGNPKPRLFRLKDDKAIINRMGFNNDGVDAAVERLKKLRRTDILIGGNIGKNKITPNELAINDYIICFQKLFDHVDYFVVNVSSPNTPGLRELQEKQPLLNILNKLQGINQTKDNPKPIFLKIAPDLNHLQLMDIIDIVKESKISGLIATNTTVERDHLTATKDQIATIGNGGLSGQPLKERSNEVLRFINQHSRGSFPVIGVGGILSGDDAVEKMSSGASLVQIYSGFIYGGPDLIKDIKRKLGASKSFTQSAQRSGDRRELDH